MSHRAVYRDAPLVLTLIEVRHPEAQPLGRGELAGLKQHLVRHTPLHRAEDVTDVQVQAGPGLAPVSTTRVRPLQRFLSRDKRTSVSYGPEAIVVETTCYQGWESFREVVEAALTARQDVAPVDGIERIGLRYIDEIRVPAEGTVDWAQWVSNSLLAPRPDAELGLQPLQQQAVVQYATPRPAETLTLRYGAVDGPAVVQSSPNLARPAVPPPGPFFLLDTDAAWTLPPGDPVPEVDPGRVLGIADRLHGPVKGLFEALITDKLRVEVFGADREPR